MCPHEEPIRQQPDSPVQSCFEISRDPSGREVAGMSVQKRSSTFAFAFSYVFFPLSNQLSYVFQLIANSCVMYNHSLEDLVIMIDVCRTNASRVSVDVNLILHNEKWK